MSVNSRKLALQIIEEVEDGGYLNLVLKKKLAGMEDRDRRFVSALCFTLLENRIRIDYIIDTFTENKRIHKLIRNILRIGICQIVFFDSVPDSAAVNECVKLTENSPKRQLKGFVNGVLRKISREKDNIDYPSREEDAARYFSVIYSYPEWICKKYIADYGEDFAEAMLSYKKEGADTCVRPNLLKTESAEKLARKLIGAAFKVSKGKYMDDAIYIKNITAVDELGLYKRGEMTVQQESSMLVVQCADIKEGMSVIDVCAAPGGKSALAFEKRPERMVSMELHEHRAEVMQKNFQRLGVTSQICVGDARSPIPEFYSAFDRVMVDAPCSALGLLYRKPDIKLNKQEVELKELSAVEREILETASRYVKKGGRLIYSTCTIDKLENDGVVDSFLTDHQEFEEIDIKKLLPRGLKDKANKGRLQLFPHVDGIDGFFICVMEKKA